MMKIEFPYFMQDEKYITPDFREKGGKQTFMPETVQEQAVAEQSMPGGGYPASVTQSMSGGGYPASVTQPMSGGGYPASVTQSMPGNQVPMTQPMLGNQVPIMQSMSGYPNSIPFRSPSVEWQNQMMLEIYRAICSLSKDQGSAIIKLQEKNAEEEKKTEEAAKRERNRADIASIKALQKTKVLVEANGCIRVKKEQFGADISDKAEFIISECKVLCCLDSSKDSVLFVKFLKNGSAFYMYLPMQDMDNKAVNKAFRRAGISFGFSHDKETFCRVGLIEEIMKTAQEVWLPPSHGWYRIGNKIYYAYPEDMTWQEVKKYEK